MVCVALCLAGWFGVSQMTVQTAADEPVRLGALTSIDPPQPFPALAMTGLDGRPAGLGTGPVLVNVWATWCPPCVRELPSLDRLAGMAGVRVVALSVDVGGPDTVKGFLARHPLSHVTVTLDGSGDAIRAFGNEGLPLTLLVNAQNRVVARFSGGTDWDRPEMARQVKDWLSR